MKNVFGANMTDIAADYFANNLKNAVSVTVANYQISEAFGIIDFFESDEELTLLKEAILFHQDIIKETDRAEYGDFQTNEVLADKVVLSLLAKNLVPEVVIEPTCGKGNFIVASLKNFKNLQYVLGIEIYKPYIWETKFNIIHFFLTNDKLQTPKPTISIVHCNVFDFDFQAVANKFISNQILVIGNPPWVTNSKLSSLNSNNLPKKNNFKNHSGLDAMTGKGNFDIGESIALMMIKTFQSINGSLLLLVKNAVIKNIVFEQKKNKYSISSIEKYSIDSKKEFNVSVEASLFYCKLNSPTTLYCTEFDFYAYPNAQKNISQFGWLKDKFVANIDNYAHTKEIDGACQFVWRQGLKHDCAAVMELEKISTDTIYYLNGLNQYLTDHRALFDARKSSIYQNKPSFSIFGIGDYSFKPYKVAISGLYKTFHFTLVLPQNKKPVMLDDTCYFLGFDSIEFAVYSLILLNSYVAKQFLESITFSDAKRTFTKDVLMRIDLLALANNMSQEYLEIALSELNEAYHFNLSLSCWNQYVEGISPVNSGQMELFA